MSITSNIRKAGPFTGNGITTSFPFAFKVFNIGEVLVVQTDVAGTETTLALTTHYTVTLNADQDTNPGGTVDMLTALPVDLLLTLTSAVDETQSVMFTNQGGFYPAVINAALDRLTIITQQIVESLGRKIGYGMSDTTNVVIPPVAERANKYLTFDINGYITPMPPPSLGTIASTLVSDIFTMRAGYVSDNEVVQLGSHTTAGDDGGGIFRGVITGISGSYVDNNGTVILPISGDGSAAWVREVTNFVTPEMFGGSSGMQAAINYAAANNLDLRLSATTYTCSKLYLRYDPVNNPGYPQGKASSIRIIGAGRVSANDEILGNFRGSVINSTVTSGTAVEFGIPTGGATTDVGQSVLSDFTIRANTTGYVLDLSDFHECTMHRMFIRQLNLAGSGVLAPTIWESDFLDVYVMGAHSDFSRKPSAYSAGIGFHIQDIKGDMIGLDHIVCRGFHVGMQIDESHQGGNVTGYRLNSITCDYGFIIGAGTTLIKLSDCHAELNTYSNVRAVSGCRKCSIDGGMFLACTDIHRASVNVSVKDTVYNGANLYTCVQAGITGAASPPTGVGVGIVDGGAIWDYDSTATDTYTVINLQSDAECDVTRAKVIVKDGASGITTTTTATISQNIGHVWFQQGYSPMPAGVGIANSASTASSANSALNNRFDPAIATQIAKPSGFREYTDSNGLTVVRQRQLALAASGNVNFSTDTIVVASGSTKTITGIASVLPAGTTVQLHILGLDVTLVHHVTTFELQDQKPVTTSATHYGAMFEFFTPNGTDWIEVSRTNLYLDPVVSFVTSVGTGPINFGNFKIMHELAGGVTITGITSTHPRGTEVTLYCIGVSVTLQHTANAFELAGSVNAVTPATHGGALFKFYTPDGTNWYEVSRRFP